MLPPRISPVCALRGPLSPVWLQSDRLHLAGGPAGPEPEPGCDAAEEQS